MDYTDNIVHTVTSGEPNSVNAGELFDSGLTALIITVPDFIAFCDIDCPKKLRNGRKDFNMSKNLFALHKNGPDNNIIFTENLGCAYILFLPSYRLFSYLVKKIKVMLLDFII